MVAFTRVKNPRDPRWLSPGLRAFYGEEVPNKALLNTRRGICPPGGGISGLPVVLSNPTVTVLPTSALLGATTNKDNGNFYWVVTTSNVQPTVAQIMVGLDAAGLPAAAFGSISVLSGNFSFSFFATGLAVLTAYTGFFVQLSGNNHQSNILSTGPFMSSGPSLRFEISSDSMYLGGPS
jgi:hypothetical protein